jgi:hypothetical protein
MREFVLGSAGAAAGTGTTVTSATTLTIIWPAAAPTMNIEFLRHWVSQAANATSAQQRIAFHTQVLTTSSYPTVTSATPAKLKRQDPNASVITGATSLAAGNCGINATVESAGATTEVWEDAFNVLNGFLKVATPAETEILPAGYASAGRFWFPTVPGTLTGWSWGQNFREV